VSGTLFAGLNPFQWLTLIVAALTLLLLADAFAGHYRSGFVFRSQYAPFVSGGLLFLSSLAATLSPAVVWVNTLLQAAGGVAVASGLIGFCFHHYYGMAKKPGGYKWLLHHLMYGAPPLAPLGLVMTGTLALISARGMSGGISVAGMNMRAALLVVVAVGLAGAILQSSILHYRGAFNNPAMYLPLTAPALAAVVSVWASIAPASFVLVGLHVLLWTTFLIGFVGLGMHLRGFGRQMGGLYVALFNWLEGPPAFAPGLFAGFAAVGIVAIKLL
jgi:hypothetical protein